MLDFSKKIAMRLNISVPFFYESVLYVLHRLIACYKSVLFLMFHHCASRFRTLECH